MKRNLIVTLIFLSLILSNCSKDQVTSPPIGGNSGGLFFKIDRQNTPENVAIVSAKLTRTGYTSIIRTLNILTDTTADLTISGVSVGTWNLKVEAFTSTNVLVYAGEASVNIQDGITTQVSLILQPVQTGVGNIYIFVTWGGSQMDWTDHINNPILSKRENDSTELGGIIHPTVLLDNGIYKMWYAGVMNAGRTVIHYAQSADGKNWSRPLNFPALTPSDSGWDSWSVQPGGIIKHENIYRLYYFGYSNQNSQWRIGMATSSDGINWTKLPNPILSGNTTGEQQLQVGSVVKANNQYYLYYSSRYPTNWSINVARSTDGLNWVKDSHNPLLTATYSWEGSGVYDPAVIYDGSQFTMVYMCATISNSKYFGIATSADGINWVKRANPTFNANKTHNNWASSDVGYPFLVKDNTGLKLYYCGIGGNSSTYRIGLAFKN